MKLVITRDLLKVKMLANVKVLTGKDEGGKDFQVHSYPDFMKHGNLLNKGTRVQIGTSEKSEELQDDEKQSVLWLNSSKAIVPIADKAVERIDREVKLEIEKATKERMPVKSMEEMIAAAVATAVAAVMQKPAKPA